ncbi:MAG: hypothetical protein ACON5N_08665 [Akkermansiaceae bacterium]
MNFKTFLMILTSLAFGNLGAQHEPQDIPESEIIGLERQPDGVDLFFTGQPGQIYAVYASNGDDNWAYLSMGAHLDRDHFHVHDPEALTVKKRLYRIVLLNQDCQQVDPWTTENLLFRVHYRSLLSEARQTDLRNAAAQYHAAMNATRMAVNAVKQAHAALADYLKMLSEARFGWIEAQHATEAARMEKKVTEKKIADKKKALEEQKTEREKARRMRDQQLHKKGVFLDWAKKFEDAGDQRKADEMRANAEEAQKRFAFWNDEVDYQDDAVEDLENGIIDLENSLPDHDTDIADKEAAEKAAKEDYESKKAGKAAFEKGVEDAKKAQKAAEKAQKDKQKAWNDKARKARADGKKESDRRAAEAHAASEAGKAGAPAPKPKAPKPSNRAIQIAKFLEHIKKHGGVDAYNEALRSMFGSALDAGLVTLEGLGAAMAQWASGKAASGGAVETALASGVVSFGYGIIAAWVQDAASAAATGIASRTMVGLIFTDAPNPGDAKYSPGRKSGKQSSSAELYLHNEDGTATVIIFRTGKPLTSKNFRLKKKK